MTRQTTMVVIHHSEKVDSSKEMSEMQLQDVLLNPQILFRQLPDMLLDNIIVVLRCIDTMLILFYIVVNFRPKHVLNQMRMLHYIVVLNRP
jgi:hypothetical protein